MVVGTLTLEPDCLGSNLALPLNQPCDLEQITQPICAMISSSIKQMMIK